MKVFALAVTASFLSACGNSSISCDNPSTKSCTLATWGGVMSPSPSCASGGTEISACPASATNTCTWTDSTTFPSPVSYTASFYAEADLAAAMSLCSTVSGTYK